jgi:hypothetical protein
MAMKQRCCDPNAAAHNRYRGMLCKRWYAFENFLADMGERPVGKTIERNDNRKGYSQKNCRWATAQEQVRNSSTPKITFANAVEINLRYMNGIEPRRSIAASFGISIANVHVIGHGQTWPDAHAVAMTIINSKSR